MFVFAETRAAAADGAPPLAAFELQDGTLKEHLPFEDLVVVAGLQAAHGAAAQSPSTPLRQLTCLSARVKPSGHRVLLVLPMPVAADDTHTLVQVCKWTRMHNMCWHYVLSA